MAIRDRDNVTVHYTGRLANGEEFDSSRNRDPLKFAVGAGLVVPGLEKAVLGKEPGDKFTVSIPAEEAYGPADPDLQFTIERSQLPAHIPAVAGTWLQLSNEQGQMDVVISKVDDKTITLDANHPLAGQDLIFDIEILKDEQK